MAALLRVVLVIHNDLGIPMDTDERRLRGSDAGRRDASFCSKERPAWHATGPVPI
jgi:hypothetical protein